MGSLARLRLSRLCCAVLIALFVQRRPHGAQSLRRRRCWPKSSNAILFDSGGADVLGLSLHCSSRWRLRRAHSCRCARSRVIAADGRTCCAARRGGKRGLILEVCGWHAMLATALRGKAMPGSSLAANLHNGARHNRPSPPIAFVPLLPASFSSRSRSLFAFPSLSFLFPPVPSNVASRRMAVLLPQL